MEKDYKNLKVGDPFEVKEVYEGKRLLLREWTSTIIALAILGAVLTALAYAAIYGDPQGTALLKVWGIVSVPISGVMGYYLRGKRIGSENDD